MNDQERLVVVTGAGRGVGAATVKALLGRPHVTVIAVSRSLQSLMEAVGPQPRMEPCTLDLEDPTAAERLARTVGARRLHALVHNAGHLHKAELGTHRRADLERVFLTNAIAPLELSQALAANLAGDPPGHIVHIGSMRPWPARRSVWRRSSRIGASEATAWPWARWIPRCCGLPFRDSRRVPRPKRSGRTWPNFL
jgi:NAD(P)-dependent dehydrogenase (short-subunit alcohol dehydrogenase family)